MSVHTKKRATSAFAEFRLVVPAGEAARVRKALGGLLPLMGDDARLSELATNAPNIAAVIDEIEAGDDDALHPVEDVIGKPTPGRMLKGLRAREGITQRELAETLGVKQHHISEMEKGARSIGLAMARRIAKAYGVSHRVFV